MMTETKEQAAARIASYNRAPSWGRFIPNPEAFPGEGEILRRTYGPNDGLTSEPRRLKVLRRAAEAASDEAHRLECAEWAHYDQAAAKAATRAAVAAERRAWRAYTRAFNAQIEANKASSRAA